MWAIILLRSRADFVWSRGTWDTASLGSKSQNHTVKHCPLAKASSSPLQLPLPSKLGRRCILLPPCAPSLKGALTPLVDSRCVRFPEKMPLFPIGEPPTETVASEHATGESSLRLTAPVVATTATTATTNEGANHCWRLIAGDWRCQASSRLNSPSLAVFFAALPLVLYCA